MFLEAFQRLLDDHCPPAVVRSIEAGGSPKSLWQAIEESGFLDVMVSEEAGGGGLGLPELYTLVCELGRHAVPLPVASTMLARAWLGTERTQGMAGLAATPVRDADGAWICAMVPAGRWVDHLLAGGDIGAWLLPASQANRVPSGVLGSGMASLRWEALPRERVESISAPLILPSAALLKAAELCGAMQKVLEMTLAYCNDRVQFGRPIGKFQAVQHQVSVMAEHIAAATVATEAAFASGARVPTRAAAALAKARVSEAAPLVAATAHALHGAIGVTQEYDLQLYTRLLHEGRIAYGSEVFWQRVLGEDFLSQSLSLADYVRSI